MTEQSSGPLLLTDGVQEQGGQPDAPSSTSSSSYEEYTVPMPERKHRIIVRERSIQGGTDFKFEADPHNVKLYDILTPQEYTDTITRVNDHVRSARATTVDAALLATGPLLVPLAFWGMRHSRQVKRRKKLLKSAIEEFNASHPELHMAWDTSMPESRLTIERQAEPSGEAPRVVLTRRTVTDVLSVLTEEENPVV